MATLAGTRLSMCMKQQQTAEMNTSYSSIFKISLFEALPYLMRRLHSVLGGVGFLGGEGRVAPPVAAADDGGGRAEQDGPAAATARRQPGGRAHQRHGTTVTPPFQSIWLL